MPSQHQKQGEKMSKSMWDWSKLLHEGFQADRIYVKRDYAEAKRYIEAIKDVRKSLNRECYVFIDKDKLHKYNRFITWFDKEYGKLPHKSKPETEAFFQSTLESITRDTPNFEKYWMYIRKITINEGSKYLR